MGERGGYEPTQEEMGIKPGSEADAHYRLTPTQDKLSKDRFKKAPLRRRHEVLSAHESTGLVKGDKGELGLRISFQEKGNRIDIKTFNYNAKHPEQTIYSAVINGHEIGGSEDPEGSALAKRLFEEHNKEIRETEKGFESSGEDIKNARKEVYREMFHKQYEELEGDFKAKKIARALLGESESIVDKPAVETGGKTEEEAQATGEAVTGEGVKEEKPPE